jgi:hypothetical protein
MPATDCAALMLLVLLQDVLPCAEYYKRQVRDAGATGAQCGPVPACCIPQARLRWPRRLDLALRLVPRGVC